MNDAYNSGRYAYWGLAIRLATLPADGHPVVLGAILVAGNVGIGNFYVLAYSDGSIALWQSTEDPLAPTSDFTSAQICRTGPRRLQVGVWSYVEIGAQVDGMMILSNVIRVNEATEARGGLHFMASPVVAWNGIRLGHATNPAGMRWAVADLYICDAKAAAFLLSWKGQQGSAPETGYVYNNGFLGDTKVETVRPRVPGTVAAAPFTAVGAPTSQQATQELQPDEDVTYAVSALVGDAEAFAYTTEFFRRMERLNQIVPGNLTLLPIYAAQWCYRTRSPGASARSYAVTVRPGGGAGLFAGPTGSTSSATYGYQPIPVDRPAAFAGGQASWIFQHFGLIDLTAGRYELGLQITV